MPGPYQEPTLDLLGPASPVQCLCGRQVACGSPVRGSAFSRQPAGARSRAGRVETIPPEEMGQHNVVPRSAPRAFRIQSKLATRGPSSREGLLRSFIDAVFENGNLLLNVYLRGQGATTPKIRIEWLRWPRDFLARDGDAFRARRSRAQEGRGNETS